MTYVQIYDLWESNALRKQIVIAVLKFAVYILEESPSTQDHAIRLAWSKEALEDPYAMAIRMSPSVVMNPDVQAGNPADSLIQGVLEFVAPGYFPAE